jgi:hypothetical protein
VRLAPHAPPVARLLAARVHQHAAQEPDAAQPLAQRVQLGLEVLGQLQAPPQAAPLEDQQRALRAAASQQRRELRLRRAEVLEVAQRHGRAREGRLLLPASSAASAAGAGDPPPRPSSTPSPSAAARARRLRASPRPSREEGRAQRLQRRAAAQGLSLAVAQGVLAPAVVGEEPPRLGVHAAPAAAGVAAAQGQQRVVVGAGRPPPPRRRARPGRGPTARQRLVGRLEVQARSVATVPIREALRPAVVAGLAEGAHDVQVRHPQRRQAQGLHELPLRHAAEVPHAADHLGLRPARAPPPPAPWPRAPR